MRYDITVCRVPQDEWFENGLFLPWSFVVRRCDGSLVVHNGRAITERDAREGAERAARVDAGIPEFVPKRYVYDTDTDAVAS